MVEYRLIDHICKELCQCEQSCTKIGEYISTNVVKHASQNIFDDISRPFVELILNSIDAYRYLAGQSSIGKFGMGFYSIFTYIIDQPDAKIVITSHTQVEHWESIITFHDGHLYFTLDDIPEDLPGTKIYIDGPKATNIDISSTYFEYVSGVQIIDEYCNSEGICTTKIFNTINDVSWPIVKINTTYIDDNEHVYVEDHATGITKDVYLHTMLIPGISTKQIQIISMPEDYLGPRTGYKIDKYDSWLIILVGEIPISINDIRGSGYKFIIQMPKQTNLPVSRDRFLPTKDNIRIYNQQVAYILEDILQKDIQALPKFSKLLHYMYGSWGNLQWIIDQVDTTVNRLPTKQIYYVPQIHTQVFQILQTITGWTFIYVEEDQVPVNHFLELENKLFDKDLPWLDNVFQGRRVLILPELTSISTNAGFGRFLFIREYPHNVQKFILAYPEDNLTPFIEDTLPTYRELISAKLFGLHTYFNITRVEQDFRLFVYNFPEELTPVYYAELCLYLNILINNVIRSTGYTDGRLKLDMYNPPNGMTDLPSRMIEYYKNIIHDQFTYFKKNLYTTIPNIWMREYSPDNGNKKYLLQHTTDTYEYLAMASMIDRYYVDRLEEYFPVLQQYWKTKLRSSYREHELLTWRPKEGDIEISSILMDVYVDTTTYKYEEYITPELRRLLSEYLFSELLQRVYKPDFYLGELYALEERQSTNSQLIPIVINQTVSNPLEYILNILNQSFVDIDFNLYQYPGEIVIYAKTSTTLKQLLYHSLPYTSPFLPIYGASSKVEIYHSGIAFIDIPIVKGDLIMDVHRSVYLTSVDTDYIAVHLPSDNINDILNGNIYIKHVMSLFNKVSYHGEIYSTIKELIFTCPIGDVWAIPMDKTSWIFHKGQPYIPVEKYHQFADILLSEDIRMYISKGFIFNIKDTTPINEDEVYYSEYAWNRDAIYYALLHNLVYRHASYANKYITNITSRGDPKQLRLQINNRYANHRLNHFLENHEIGYYPDGKLNNMTHSIAFWINKIINDNTYDIHKVLFGKLPHICQQVIEHWLAYKQPTEKQLVHIKELSLYTIKNLQHFVDVWWSIAKQLNIPEIHLDNQSPKVNITILDTNVLGQYNPNTHEIRLAMDGDYTNYEQPTINWEKLIISGDPYITNIFPPPTLIHELYHAVLNNSHAGGHPSMFLTINGVNKEYLFNSGAMEIYKEVILRDLVDHLNR